MERFSASQDFQSDELFSQVSVGDAFLATDTSGAVGSTSQSPFFFSLSRTLDNNLVFIENDPVVLTRSCNILKVPSIFGDI